MPELPEVETIKNYLKKFLIGKRILGFENLDRKRVKVKEKEIAGEKILDVERRGKILVLKLSNNKNIFVHLKMTGQLVYLKDSAKFKTTRAIFKLSKGFFLFNDARKFGWMKLRADEFKKLGIEPFSKEFNLENLKKIFKQTKRPIKIVLMDQTKIAGIGNIYASESLFLAKINPRKLANQLTKEEIKRLRSSILKILKKALRYEGTSSRFYIKPDQSKGLYQEKFLVYQRVGNDCFCCQGKIKRIILGGRSTFYCENCQK